jgi:hypothetical protein
MRTAQFYYSSFRNLEGNKKLARREDNIKIGLKNYFTLSHHLSNISAREQLF